jgi:hypothetical protein
VSPWVEFAILWIAAALSTFYVLQGQRRLQNAIVSLAFLLLALLRIVTAAAKHGEPF